jgi:hypothetical protein
MIANGISSPRNCALDTFIIDIARYIAHVVVKQQYLMEIFPSEFFVGVSWKSFIQNQKTFSAVDFLY